RLTPDKRLQLMARRRPTADAPLAAAWPGCWASPEVGHDDLHELWKRSVRSRARVRWVPGQHRLPSCCQGSLVAVHRLQEVQQTGTLIRHSLCRRVRRCCKCGRCAVVAVSWSARTANAMVDEFVAACARHQNDTAKRRTTR